MRRYAALYDHDNETTSVIYQDDEDRDVWYVLTPVSTMGTAKDIAEALAKKEQ